MNYKRTSIAWTLMLFIVAVLVSLTVFAVDTLPKGWRKAGSHPPNYEMSVDTAVKHSGKAGAHINFIGDKAEGSGVIVCC